MARQGFQPPPDDAGQAGIVDVQGPFQRVDGVKRLESLGVTDAIVGFRNAYQMEQDSETLDQKIAAMKWYADEIIAKS